MKYKLIIGLIFTGTIIWSFQGISMFRFGMMGGFMDRHREVMHSGVPASYQGKENPLDYKSDEILKKGENLFISTCSVCHGVKGKGDGPGGKNLNPKPANLNDTMNSSIGDDDFLYWTISEGGVPFKTAMPPFKEVFDEDQIWSIISYLQTFKKL